jgi:hypothetical protein
MPPQHKLTVCEDVAEWFKHHNQTRTTRGYIPSWWVEVMQEVEELE